MAYQLATTLRQQYLDKGLPIPLAERQQAIRVLVEEFAISQNEAESSLATGFFESR